MMTKEFFIPARLKVLDAEVRVMMRSEYPPFLTVAVGIWGRLPMIRSWWISSLITVT